MPVKNRFAELHDDITAWRRDIHTHPEILFETHRTSALVAEKPLLICKAMGASGFHEFYKDAIEVAARASGKTATAATGGKGGRGGKGSSSAAGAAGSLADGPDGLISKVAVSNKHLLK